VDWWVGAHRIHPARQITVALVRPAGAEVIAREWFAALVKDARRQRAALIRQWRHRTTRVASIDPWVDAVRAAVRGDDEAAYRRTRQLVGRCRELRML
jgi:hypothetical protein